MILPNLLARHAPDLRALIETLIRDHQMPPRLRNITLKHDPAQDKRNESDPRAFCYAKPDDLGIYCAQALGYLPVAFLYGVLLHEIGHIHLKAFNGEGSEVDVDLWCATDVKNSGYDYDNCYYIDQKEGTRFAESLERVSDKFVHRVANYYE